MKSSPTTTTSDNTERLASDLEQRARDYLTGYGRHNLPALQQLAQFAHWQRLATQELERRAYSLIQAFDHEMLQAIAQGDLRIERVADQVAQALTSTAQQH